MRRKFHLKPVKTNADTIGGYILELAGTIPQNGDVFFDTVDNTWVITFNIVIRLLI